jgi:hypothetical protein
MNQAMSGATEHESPHVSGSRLIIHTYSGYQLGLVEDALALAVALAFALSFFLSPLLLSLDEKFSSWLSIFPSSLEVLVFATVDQVSSLRP